MTSTENQWNKKYYDEVTHPARPSLVFLGEWAVTKTDHQGCGVARSRNFFGGVGFLRTLEVRFFYPALEVQLNHFLHRTPK